MKNSYASEKVVMQTTDASAGIHAKDWGQFF
jgi:hypothetical protein